MKEKDKKTALFPGSFDPITVAHVDVVKRAMPLFDKIIIGIGLNTSKSPLLSAETRKSIIAEVYKNYPHITIEIYEGLTIDFCSQINANYMIRGIRSVADFEYERAISQLNRSMAPEIDTVFLLSRPEYSAISSTFVREILRYKGNVSKFVPPQALNFL